MPPRHSLAGRAGGNATNGNIGQFHANMQDPEDGEPLGTYDRMSYDNSDVKKVQGGLAMWGAYVPDSKNDPRFPSGRPGGRSEDAPEK